MRFQQRPTRKRASYAHIWMAASSPAVRHGGTQWAQMNRLKMRGGPARFWAGAIPQSRDRPSRVGGGAACEKHGLEAIVLSE